MIEAVHDDGLLRESIQIRGMDFPTPGRATVAGHAPGLVLRDRGAEAHPRLEEQRRHAPLGAVQLHALAEANVLPFVQAQTNGRELPPHCERLHTGQRTAQMHDHAAGVADDEAGDDGVCAAPEGAIKHVVARPQVHGRDHRVAEALHNALDATAGHTRVVKIANALGGHMEDHAVGLEHEYSPGAMLLGQLLQRPALTRHDLPAELTSPLLGLRRRGPLPGACDENQALLGHGMSPPLISLPRGAHASVAPLSSPLRRRP